MGDSSAESERILRTDVPASVIDDRLMRAFPVHPSQRSARTLLRRSHSPFTLSCKYHLYTRQNSTLAMPEQTPQQPPTIEVPHWFHPSSENTTHILLPSDNGAFLNPVQEFNRDLSVACIRVWSEEWNRAKEAKWRATQEKKAKKPEKRLKGVSNGYIPWVAAGDCNHRVHCGRFGERRGVNRSKEERGMLRSTSFVLKLNADLRAVSCAKFVLLEALSATGLRSIRYAKEIPLVKSAQSSGLLLLRV
jgi:hypothetical protein